MVWEQLFQKRTVRKGPWNIPINSPPDQFINTSSSSLCVPFLKLVSAPAQPAKPAVQPKEKDEKEEKEEKESVVAQAERKQKIPFKRSAPLDGQLRTFKVLMCPTAAQKVELKRCFAVARLRYNQTNALIKDGAPATMIPATMIIEIRNQVLNLPQPEWANRNLRVARSIQESAEAQCVAAYSSNEAKKKINSRHNYEVKFTSLKHNKTEVIAMEKDYSSHSSTLLRFEAALALKNRKGRAECFAFFGNNLAAVGGIRQWTDSASLTAWLRTATVSAKTQRFCGTSALVPSLPQHGRSAQIGGSRPHFCQQTSGLQRPGLQSLSGATEYFWTELCRSWRTAAWRWTRSPVASRSARKSLISMPALGRVASAGARPALKRKLVKDRRRLHGWVEWTLENMHQLQILARGPQGEREDISMSAMRCEGGPRRVWS
jgi:hypothetical protein